MAPEPAQNYANHVRRPPTAYLAAGLVFAVSFLWALYGLKGNLSFASILGVLFAASLLALFICARAFAITVQDRVIRLEMQLRLERLLPQELRSRIGEFTVKQLVALRFAGDAELPGLARDVLDGKVTEPDAIKRAIQNWKADWLRA
jgi:uncharacterized protein (DUF58 family)